MTSRRILLAVSLLSFGVWGASCSSSSDTAPVVVDHSPSTLAAVSSTTQLGVAGTALDPIAVRVTMKSGDVVAGASVSFHVVSGGGAVNPATATTDDQGIATTTWTLGPETGSQSIAASSGSLAPVTFAATAATGPASAIAKVGGDGQQASAGAAVAVVPQVRVVDASGNPVAGVTVTFAVASGGGSVSGATATSAADGSASPTSWTLGTGVGANTLRAAAGTATTTFTATAVAGAPATLTFASVAPGELEIGDQVSLTTRAFDTYGNENTGAIASYTVSPPYAATVDASGNLMAVTPGAFTVVAKSGAAQVSYSAAVIGHPLSLQIASQLYIGASPDGISVTDDGAWAIRTDGSIGELTHYDLQGAALNVPVQVESAALSYIVMAPRSSGTTVVVTNVGAISSEFWFVDIATNAIVDSVMTGRYVQSGQMSADGKRAYILLDAGELAVIDATTHKFLPSIPLGAGIQSFIIAHGDTTGYAYSSAGTMFEIDLARGVVRRQFSMPAFTEVDVSRDGSLFYALDNAALFVRVLRTSDLGVVRLFSTTGSHIAASPDGRELFVTTSGGSGSFIQSFTGDAASGFTLGPSFTPTDTPVRLLFDSFGGTLFVVNASGTVDVIRANPCTMGACRPPPASRRRP
ncbi:MAG: hypothetical protein ACREPM_15925 [Gemmatimonadaceae bacterium]